MRIGIDIPKQSFTPVAVTLLFESYADIEAARNALLSIREPALTADGMYFAKQLLQMLEKVK